MARFMVLGLLRGGERLHGYALWKGYEQRSGQRIHSGKFYRTLKSLAEARLIRPSALSDDDLRRMPYEITTAGAQAFDDWVVAFDSGRDPFADEISARAPFVFELPAAVAESFFAVAADVLGARLKRLEYERDRVLSRPGLGERERTVSSSLLARSLARTAADMEWLSETRSSFSRLHVPPAAAEAIATAPAPVRKRAGRRTRG